LIELIINNYFFFTGFFGFTFGFGILNISSYIEYDFDKEQGNHQV
jgi:hypothetical protein